MKLRPLILLLTVLPSLAPGQAVQPDVPADLAKRPEYRQARTALEEGLPAVAVVKLQRLENAKVLTGEARRQLRLLLAEALLRAGKTEEVIVLTNEDDLRGVPEAAFWRALALAGRQRWTEAARELSPLAEQPGFRYSTEVTFCRAGVLASLGEPARAAMLLTPVLKDADAGTATRARVWAADLLLAAGDGAEAAKMLQGLDNPPEKLAATVRYLQARALLATGDAAGAVAGFNALMTPSPRIPARLQHSAALGKAEALQQSGKPEEALGVLEQLIGGSPVPADEILELAFRQFEQLNRPPTREAENFLTSWAAAADPPLRARARIARVAAMDATGSAADVAGQWAAVAREMEGNPLLAVVLLRQAQHLISQGQRDAALPVVDRILTLSPGPQVRAWAEWLKGRADYETGKYKTAAKEFTAAGSAGDPDVRIAAAFNAAMAELQSGRTRTENPLAMLDSVSAPEAREAGAEYHLERALYLASHQDEGAADSLEAFVRLMPEHPRKFEALIALAELAWTRNPPQPVAAAQHAEAAAAAAMTPAQQERVARLRVYISGAAGGPEGADAMAKAALEFFTAWPASPGRSDLRMHLGVNAYLREDFARASQYFEELARDEPQHPLAEAALFWAGRATVLTLGQDNEQKAISLWEEVYKRNGPLKWQVRLQEALLNQRRKDYAAALQLLDEILAAPVTADGTGPPLDAATRWQVLCTRGEVLATGDLVPGKTTGPDPVSAGLASFDLVIADPAAPRGRRHEALVRKGVCLEVLKREDEAIEAYYDALNDPPVVDDGPGEDYWFHRAGEKARRLLETARKFEEAVEIARKMAKAPGPRGRAAAELVNQLALKYGIYLDER